MEGRDIMLDGNDNRLLEIHTLAYDHSRKLTLEEVLFLAKIELAITPPPPSHTNSRAAVFFEDFHRSVMLEARLYGFHPFSRLNESTLWTPSGSGSLRQGTALQWVARQLLAGIAPSSIIETAHNQYAENGYDALEISKVSGIEVDDIVKITEGYELWPHDKLPSDARKILLFDDAGAVFRTPNSCALVHHFRHNMVIDPDYQPSGVDMSKDRFGTSNMRRANKRLEIQRAIILSTSGTVGMPFTYCRAATDHIMDADRSYGGFLESAGFQSETPNIDAVRENLRLLEDFNAPAALHVAIDRLGKARGLSSNVDKALDLGMALEIALMHENGGGGSGEITYKLSSRAAWLLGKNPEERSQVFEKAKKIYGHRSVAAHSGRLKNESDFLSLDAHAFTTRILREILQRGSFPVWHHLIFGVGGRTEAVSDTP